MKVYTNFPSLELLQ